MPKKKKNNKSINFIDEIKRFSKFEDLKIEDRVVYKRVSDSKMSVGDIKWFCNSAEGMCASVIDVNLGNFQLGLCKFIKKDATASSIQKLLSKKRKTK